MLSLRTFFLLVLSFGCLGTTPVQAQRLGNQFYLRLGAGGSDYAGEASKEAGVADFYDTEKFTESPSVPHTLAAELGYQITRSFSLGLGYQFGTYYAGRGRSRELQTAQLLGRYKVGAARWAVAPYLDVGAHLSTDTKRLAYGPALGVGLDVSVNNQVSLFVESRVNLTFPDEAVDREAGEGSPDVLSALPALGATVLLRPTPSPPRVRSIDGPTTVQVDETVTYSATIDEAAARPVRKTWTFGDGGRGRGETSLHIFNQPGTYTVLFEAKNEAGSDTEVLTVTVEPSSAPARVDTVAAVPDSVTVGADVGFRARARGTPPLSYAWHFGDGSVDSTWFATHTYREPGSYTVELIVSNETGRDTSTLSLSVNSARAQPAGREAPHSADSARASPSDSARTAPAGRAQGHAGGGSYTVQVGAFTEREHAETKALQVLFDGFPARIRSDSQDGRTLYRVWAGSFETEQAARRSLEQFRDYAPDSFVKETTQMGAPGRGRTKK